MMVYPWHLVPDDIRTDFVQCSNGYNTLLNLATRCIEASQQNGNTPFLLALGADILAAAWEEFPLGDHAARQLMQLETMLPRLHPASRILLATLCTRFAPPTDREAQLLTRFNKKKKYQALSQYALDALSRTPDAPAPSLSWWGLLQQAACADGRFDWLAEQLAKDTLLPAPLRAGALGDCAMLCGEWSHAVQYYATAYAAVPLGVWHERHGQALVQLGRTDEALQIWNDLLTQRPWHVNLASRRDGLVRGLEQASALPDTPGVILLYTWNGGQKILHTLESLFESELPPYQGTAQILIADNGSLDGQTPEILAAFAKKSGGRMRVLTFPCNIGAPAARNWLLTEPESRSAEWIVYLDDDILLPPDWLGHFSTAMRSAPDHLVYGCQVLLPPEKESSRLIQASDMHLIPIPAGKEPNPNAVSYLQASYYPGGQLDYGQFTYARPAIHVSGCCHLFRRAAFEKYGGFDLRFSPSQFDDFEHDVRLASHGVFGYYHGYLRIHHMHATGRACIVDSPKAMNSHANHLKLQSLYPVEIFHQLRAKEAELLLRDAVRCMKM